ncbi:PEP/pyruvate-binding domain-containing protein [Yinghuangia soli]|uniref:Pyruvate, water dikinase n=1 Tax=Yinghuangia soli TaxID=2908204 RepID=A0AA41U3Y9_9ACTN|nr:PEP/pyruvate-binding domain-containing protein [Yinghuangia soli]MCF2530252.1 hypothetical protein [Yinghuangia soli]
MRSEAASAAGGSRVVALDAERARDTALTGAKAANLARAKAAGLPVLPGFVLVAGARLSVRNGQALPEDDSVLVEYRRIAGPGERPLVVRSSSVHEDTATSSMAGCFVTVPDVRGWEAFTRAVAEVRASADLMAAEPAALSGTLGAGPRAGGEDSMAVLVQPMLRADAGGVMFGADPVTGRTDRIVVSAVHGTPAALVDGTAQGVRYLLDRTGRCLETEPQEPSGQRLLGRGRLFRLAALARRAGKLFGGPQDIEFAFDTDDRLWLLQSRPITAMAPRPPAKARLLGPGPVAETFPGVLQPLEEDLWVAPMAHGLTVALQVLGTASRHMLREVPPVLTVDGRAAADLRLLGVVPPRHPVLSHLNPVPAARGLGAAWRIGRLRGTLPLLALDLMADVDRELAELPPPARMSGGQALAAAGWGRRVLSALHAQESLAGGLLGADRTATVAGEALAVLAEGRAAGRTDAEILAAHPVLLGLSAPSLTRPVRLPPRGAAGPWTGVPRGVSTLPVREGLRLRIRWVQEMQAGMVRAFADRLVAAGLLPDAGSAVLLRWYELTAVGEGAALPPDLADRLPRPEQPPLPAAFRLAGTRVVAEPLPTRTPGRGHRRAGGPPGDVPGAVQGLGAGGGFGTGTVWDGRGPRPEHAVLVVGVLDPGLASYLPGLAALVAETGSPLSHLAVLARERRIPTATAVPEAVARFPVGTEVAVDGGTGSVVPHDAGLRNGAGPARTSRPSAQWSASAAPDPSLRALPRDRSPRPPPGKGHSP